MTEGTPIPRTIYERFPYLKPIAERGELPNHVAIIMDGNRRWAKKVLGEDTKPIEGHRAGMNKIIEILQDLRQIDRIKYVTLYAFSADNWNRDPAEVVGLMGLFAEGIPLILDEVKRNNGRVVHLGRKDRISRLFPEVRAVLDTAEIETATNTGQVVCLGIDYGAQDQELRAMQKLLALKLPKGTPITPELLKRLSDTHLKDGTDIPPIDLIFRPGGDQRTSGLPNAEYAEFYSIIPPLPATTALDYVLGLVNYSKRPRSFGGDCAVK